MKRIVEGDHGRQISLLPRCLEDYVPQDNPVHVVEAFIDQLDLRQAGFDGLAPTASGRPANRPAVAL